MAGRLHLEVVTPREQVVDEVVDEVRVPGMLGEFGVLPEHTPLLSSLGIGVLTYRVGTAEHVMAVGAGFVEVLPDKVTVLAQIAERPDQIDAEAARREVQEAEASLTQAGAEDFERLAGELRLAETRVEVAATHTG